MTCEVQLRSDIEERFFWLNGKLRMTHAHFQGKQGMISRSSHAKFAIQRFFAHRIAKKLIEVYPLS